MSLLLADDSKESADARAVVGSLCAEEDCAVVSDHSVSEIAQRTSGQAAEDCFADACAASPLAKHRMRLAQSSVPVVVAVLVDVQLAKHHMHPAPSRTVAAAAGVDLQEVQTRLVGLVSAAVLHCVAVRLRVAALFDLKRAVALRERSHKHPAPGEVSQGSSIHWMAMGAGMIRGFAVVAARLMVLVIPLSWGSHKLALEADLLLA